MKQLVLEPQDFEDIKHVVRGETFQNGEWLKGEQDNCTHEWFIGEQKSLCIKCLKVDNNFKK